MLRTIPLAVSITFFFASQVHAQKVLKETNASSVVQWPSRSVHDTVIGEVKSDIPMDSVYHFCIGQNSPQINVWGRGMESPGIYLPEYLPAFFNRTIDFSEFNTGDGYLDWIFTGEHGGITIRFDNKEVILIQRYYDSYGFNQPIQDSEKIITGRHPEKNFFQSKTTYHGSLKRISITSSHDLMIRIYINDILISEQASLLDLSRHQLRYTGKSGNICGLMKEPTANDVKISVDNRKTFQTILGFGGSASIPAYWMLDSIGKMEWWKLIKEYNLLIQREYPIGSRLKSDYSNWDDPASANPHYYGDNFPNGEISDFNYIKKIHELQGTVIFEFWVLPPWCYGPGKDSIIYEKYTEAMINYCRTSLKKSGKAPDIVGVENEITLPAEKWHQMVLYLRKALDDNGFSSVKIHMHNAAILSKGIQALVAFESNVDVWKKIDFSTSNMYDYQGNIFHPEKYEGTMREFHKAADGKPFIFTEICVNAPQLQQESYKLSFSYGELYHNNLTIMDAVSIMYCWTILTTEQPSYAATRSLFKVDLKNGVRPAPSSYQLRVFGSFSRHLLKDMVRIEAGSSDPELLVSAYQDSYHKTLVILNKGTNSKTIQLSWPKILFYKMERSSPYASNREELYGDHLKISGGEIITLYQ